MWQVWSHILCCYKEKYGCVCLCGWPGSRMGFLVAKEIGWPRLFSWWRRIVSSRNAKTLQVCRRHCWHLTLSRSEVKSSCVLLDWMWLRNAVLPPHSILRIIFIVHRASYNRVFSVVNVFSMPVVKPHYRDGYATLDMQIHKTNSGHDD
jgi:hypothetical protein